MRRGLIVKGRRYYSPKFGEYVIAKRRGAKFSTFSRANGETVRIAHTNVFYVSVDDFNMCDELAMAAKMTWFFSGLDDSTNTEINLEEADEHHVRSYRNAIRDLSEGLINEDFKRMTDPVECFRRFCLILHGMGLPAGCDYMNIGVLHTFMREEV